MIGIYKIENTINHKIYIGQSRNIKKRINKHKTTANNPQSSCYEYPLYRAMRKYGINAFSFDVIEECIVDDLNNREIYWIDYYNSFFNGYNQTLGGDASAYLGDKDRTIGIIHDLENTTDVERVIAKRWKISLDIVSGINTGRYWHHNRTYPIRKRHEREQYYCIDCGKPIWYKSVRCRQCEARHKQIPLDKMPVTREELKYKIRNISFVQIAKQYNVNDNTIRKWCDKFGLPRHRYEIEQYSDDEWALI